MTGGDQQSTAAATTAPLNVPSADGRSNCIPHEEATTAPSTDASGFSQTCFQTGPDRSEKAETRSNSQSSFQPAAQQEE
jgi:hypothetical protein